MNTQSYQHLSVRPDIPFSWSFFRHTLFNKCQRAYFYHYYGAQGGWDQYALERSQSIHRLKKIKTANQWHEEVFIQCLRELFIAPGGARDPIVAAKQFKEIIRKTINRCLKDDLNHQWGDDHTKLNLFEHYYCRDTRYDAYQQSKTRLDAAVDKLVQCGIFEELCQVKYFQWKSFSPPIYAYVDRKQVWASPALIWSDKSVHNILNLRLTEPTDDYPLSLGISAIYLAQRSGVPYTKIQCRKVFIHDTIDIYSGHCSSDDLALLIETSSSEMLEKMSEDNIAFEHNFSRCNDPRKCSLCNFQEVCLDNA